MLAFLLLHAASAAELVPALVLPSAAVIEAGGGQAAAGVWAGGGNTPHVAGTLRGSVGITDRLAINAGLRAPWGGLLLGFRYNVVQTPSIRVAPFLFGAANDSLLTQPGTDPVHALAAGGGVALEGGWQTARIDISLPFAVTGVDPLLDPLYAPLALGTAGVSVAITPRHTLRVGVETLGSPALGLRYARERWYAQGTAMYSVLRAVPMLTGEAGLRF